MLITIIYSWCYWVYFKKISKKEKNRIAISILKISFYNLLNVKLLIMNMNTKNSFDSINKKFESIYKMAESLVKNKNKNSIAYRAQIANAIEVLYNGLLELNELKPTEKKEIKLVKEIRTTFLSFLHKNITYIEQANWVNRNQTQMDNENLILKINNVSKYYSSKKMAIRVLQNINLEINNGDFVVFLGPSGSGKTTLMNLISGIDRPTTGNLWVNNYRLEEMDEKKLTIFRRNNIGYVFQRYGLLPNLTVLENVLMGSYLGKSSNSFLDNRIYKNTSYSKEELKKLNKDEKEKNNLNRKEELAKIENILKGLELFEFKDKYPYELSGGQKQRTSIARTIAKNPKIIFGDEPTGAVDSEMSGQIVKLFQKINEELKTTIIIITHDETIANYANKVFYILDGKLNRTVVKKKGEPIEMYNNKNNGISELEKSTNFINKTFKQI
ncbi:glutamine transport ATP-binding protein [Malacoplasma penetrans HF-2]|uniref:Glutamine transport ATP-binding protein n=3 Tax=Malacoplasma penetrans TaxID=28227 RepID=Q8EVK6_MALP2|nr:glutamine transport ATP-binding protein [Malacoplasma penetrans HF-2]